MFISIDIQPAGFPAASKLVAGHVRAARQAREKGEVVLIVRYNGNGDISQPLKAELHGYAHAFFLGKGRDSAFHAIRKHLSEDYLRDGETILLGGINTGFCVLRTIEKWHDSIRYRPLLKRVVLVEELLGDSDPRRHHEAVAKMTQEFGVRHRQSMT